MDKLIDSLIQHLRRLCLFLIQYDMCCLHQCSVTLDTNALFFRLFTYYYYYYYLLKPPLPKNIYSIYSLFVRRFSSISSDAGEG